MSPLWSDMALARAAAAKAGLASSAVYEDQRRATKNRPADEPVRRILRPSLPSVAL